MILALCSFLPNPTVCQCIPLDLSMHSIVHVLHPHFSHGLQKLPPLKNFIRAVSYVTGFMIRPSGDGSSLTYITQSDPKGMFLSFDFQPAM